MAPLALPGSGWLVTDASDFPYPRNVLASVLKLLFFLAFLADSCFPLFAVAILSGRVSQCLWEHGKQFVPK